MSLSVFETILINLELLILKIGVKTQKLIPKTGGKTNPGKNKTKYALLPSFLNQL